MGEAGGRRPPAPGAPAPLRPRLLGGSGSPALWPGLPGSTGCSARLSRLGPRGLGQEMPPRDSPSPGRATQVPPCAPTGPRPGVSGGVGRPLSPNALLWPDVGGCGVEGAVPRGWEGRHHSPSLGRRVPSAGGFIYASKQSWLPLPSRARRLQGLSARAVCPQDPGLLLAKSRGASARVTWPGGGNSPLQQLPTPTLPPGVAAAPAGTDDRRRWPSGGLRRGWRAFSEAPGTCAAPAPHNKRLLEGRARTGLP